MDQENMNQEGLSRRDLLRRGAALGGALAWATPVVQVIGMSPALAQTASPPPPDGDCTKWASKYEDGEWEANNEQPCGGCPDSNLTASGDAYLLVTHPDENSWKVCPRAGVTIFSAVVKAGQDCVTIFAGSDGCVTFTKGVNSRYGFSNALVCFCVATDLT